MASIKKYICGYVRIRLESPAPDRFFSLCVHNQIPLRNLTQEGSCYEMELSARDFLRLGRFRRKTNARIHILRKNGLPFFLHHARKRKAFFLGIFLGFFCYLYVLFASGIFRSRETVIIPHLFFWKHYPNGTSAVVWQREMQTARS